LQGINVSLRVVDAAGMLQTLSLPFTFDQAPGWETQSWWLRFSPGINAVTLRIIAVKSDAVLTCGRVALVTMDPPGTASPATTQPAAPAANLIPDGDFETGQAHFFAANIYRWPNREEVAMPLNWRFVDAAAVGEHALELDVTRGTARVGFGPLNLN